MLLLFRLLVLRVRSAPGAILAESELSRSLPLVLCGRVIALFAIDAG